MKHSTIFRFSYFILPLLLLYITSCTKALEESPKSLSAEGFYNTKSEVEAATYAIYSPLRTGGSMSAFYEVFHDALSDFFIPNGSWIPLEDYTGLDNTNYGRTEAFWKSFYLSIRNANLVIKNTPNGTDISDADKAVYIAEARFMRALMYFQLVRNWGGVPIRTEANMDIPDLQRGSVEAVYQLIEDDLKFAGENLPTKAAQSGRPNKWSAKAVLADTYLQLKRYTDAQDRANEVIQSGQFSLVPVTQPDDFLNLYGPDVITSSEEIFYLKFTRQNGQGFQLTLYEAHPNTPYANGAGYFSLYTDPTKIAVVKNWDANDLRKQYDLYPWQFGRGDSTYLVRKFQDKQALPGGTGGNDYPWYRYADVLMTYAEAANAANHGPTTAAVEALNKVHRRAYGYPANTASPVDFKVADYNESSFLTLIVKERGYETLFEGKRWMELKRLGIAKDYIKASKGKTMADVMLLWPIPNAEINYNKALDPVADQNPGY
ncbi:RagB/SusD family nutrient uptake outer membrane protein [Chitinophaga sp. MM2321]|uniref:RagB/SusD family nutrient uptake outer membrane protein n=1 Tax=Chitinophaga sp. MM2321 TaxID=3137178 RepID=UPI0032D56A7B